MSDANVGEGVVEITADTTKAEKAVAGLGSNLDKQADGLISFGKKGLLATGLLIGGLGAAGKAASDLNESTNAVTVTFGANAAGILKLGEDAATAVGLSNAAFNGLAVQFSAFATTIAGEGGNVVSTIEQITQRAADFASVMNIDVAEAARLFQSGLAGETEPLRKFGIDLSAAAIEAHALETGVIDGSRAMTEAEKVQVRYALLMQQTGKTAGDFAATSDGAANSQRILAAEFTNMAAKIGEQVLPPLTSLITAASALVGWISSANDATGGAIGKFGLLAVAATGLVSVVSLLGGHFLKLRDKVTTLNADGSRSMSSFGKGVSAAAGLIGIATVVYGIYADQKAEARAITDEFTAALKAEQEGQQGAIDALVARKVAESGVIELAERAGISATDLARVVKGEQVPAWDALNEVINGNVTELERMVAGQNDTAEAADLSRLQALGLGAAIGKLSRAHRTAGEELAIAESITADFNQTQATTNTTIVAGAETLVGYNGTLTETGALFGTTAELTAAYEAKLEEADAAQERMAASLEVVIEAQETARENVIKLIESLNDQVSAMRSAADATYAVRAATDDYTDFLQGLDAAVIAAGDDQEALNRIYRDGTGRAADLADATVRVYEETLAVSGQTLTATARLDTFNQSMLNSAASASGPLRQGILDYLVQVNNIPADKVTALEMYVNAGLMDEAQRLIDETSAAREVAISADVVESSLDGVETLLGTLTRPRFVKINGEWVGAKFAEGTDYAPGGTALVGEEGPELVKLPRGAQVFTAAETAGILRDMRDTKPATTRNAPGPAVTIDKVILADATSVDGFAAALNFKLAGMTS